MESAIHRFWALEFVLLVSEQEKVQVVRVLGHQVVVAEAGVFSRANVWHIGILVLQEFKLGFELFRGGLRRFHGIC